MSEMAKVDVVGVGLNATDTVITLPVYPARGSKTEYSVESVMPGGQVATTVAACQMWGLKSRYVGKLGDDEGARLHAKEFARLGVEARLVEVAGAPSPKSLILVDWDGERTVMCRRDERMILRPEELNREWIVNAQVLHVDGHDTAAATTAARWARKAGVAVTGDLDEIYPGIEELVENVDYVIGSSDFACRLMAEDDVERALKNLQAKYGCRLAASTMGPDGVLAWDGREFHRRPAYSVPVMDSTGAGDIFRAGFIYGLQKGWGLERQLDFSCAAAAMNCMSAGARGGIGSVDAIETMMASAPRYEMVWDVPAVD